MRDFKTKIEGYEGDFEFKCYDNTVPIEIGEEYIFFFCGIADVQVCDSETVKSEINKHDRPLKNNVIDFVHGFWKKCYKIKTTNFNLSSVL